MTTLAINLVTRGRPHLAAATLRYTLENIKLNSTREKLMVSIDDDDTESVKYGDWPPGIYPDVRPREDDLGSKYNRITNSKYYEADIYMPLVDYTPQITPGFDLQIIQAFERLPGGIGVVRNGYANLSFPKSQAISHKFVEIVGWLWPPYFPYWFGDHWIDSLARMTNTYAWADFDIGVLPRDPKYWASPQVATMEYREPDFWTALFDLGYVERERQARRILEALPLTPNYREFMISNFPEVRQRDRMINDCVRAQGQGAKPIGDPTPRYLRLKSKAKVLAKQWLEEASQ